MLVIDYIGLRLFVSRKTDDKLEEGLEYVFFIPKAECIVVT